MGQVNLSAGTPSKFFYNKDHIGSIRELTDSNGAIKTRYGYDPYGFASETFVSGTTSADTQFAGYYLHGRSGLNMSVYRAYNPGLGRFISRDPEDESSYIYGDNNPVSFIDPLGLWSLPGPSSGYNGWMPGNAAGTSYLGDVKSWTNAFTDFNKSSIGGSKKCFYNALHHCIAAANLTYLGLSGITVNLGGVGIEVAELVGNVGGFAWNGINRNHAETVRYRRQLRESFSEDTLIDLYNDNAGSVIGNLSREKPASAIAEKCAEHAANQCGCSKD